MQLPADLQVLHETDARRICLVNRYCYPDGSATSQLLSDLASDLCSRGWQVTLVGSRQRYDDADAQLPAREDWRGVDIHRVRTTRFGRANLAGRALDYLSFYFGLVPVLLRVLRSGDLVVAKTDPPLLGVFVAPLAYVRGARLVNWLQDLFPEVAVALGKPRLASWVADGLRRMRNSSLRRAERNVVIGERMRQYLLRQGLPESKLVTIQNWSQQDSIRPMSKQQSQLRTRLGLQQSFVVGYSGNLGRAHEWKPLFDAAKLLASDSGIVFLVSGGGYGYEQLRRAVSSSGLINVLFQPYHPLETLSDSMAAADLHLVSLLPVLEGLVMPSKFYGIAAAARAIAFVGDRDGELASLIEASQCGFSIDAGRGDLLADAILELARDPQLALCQGERARRLLESHFSRAAALERWHHMLAGMGTLMPSTQSSSTGNTTQ